MNIRIMARKATSVLLTLCVTVSLFTYGLSANAAAGGQMFEFKSTAGYPVVEYLSSTEFVKGDSYTFSCKFLATSNNFTYTTAQLKNVFIFWGANSSGGGTRPVWANMPGFSIGYNAETRTVTARFTAGDDSANGYTMTPGTNDYIQFRFGDRNAAFRGWGNFYFADFSLVRDSTGAEIITSPIESSYVTSGAPASNKDKWSTAAAGDYCAVKEKGTTFDSTVQQVNTNLFYIDGNKTNLQVQIRTTGDFFKYVAGERYEFTCKIKCNVSQNIKRGKLLHFNYYNNNDSLAAINNTTDENFTESYDVSTCVYTAVFTVPSDCRNYTNTYFAFGDRNDQLSGYQAYFTDFAIKRISTGTVTVFPLITTDNGFIGVSPTGATLKNLSEYARDAGKKVGIVTNDGATGATPACFGAHVDSRGSTSDIAQQLVSFAPDVLIGQDYADFSGLDLSGFVLAQDFSEFRNVLNTYNRQCDKKFMGFINYNATYSGEINILSHCTETALNCLSKNSPDGFFLMVENTTTDSAGHANYISGKINGVVALDRAVAAVLKFMGDNPDTLLIITSDHETGGVTIPSGSYSLDASLFTTTKHTNANVRTFAVGYGAEYFNGVTVDNTDIGKFAINALTN